MSDNDRTATKRNAEYRQRLRESGLVLVQVWARPEDREKVRRYAERLRRAESTAGVG